MIQKITESLRAKILGVSIGWTLSLVLLLGLLPALVMGQYFSAEVTKNITVMDNELEGLRLLRDMRSVGDFAANIPSDPEMHSKGAAKQIAVLNAALKKT